MLYTISKNMHWKITAGKHFINGEILKEHLRKARRKMKFLAGDTPARAASRGRFTHRPLPLIYRQFKYTQSNNSLAHPF